LDVEPRLLILPSNGSEGSSEPKRVRILCGGYKIVDTGAGRVVVNVAERRPAHLLAAAAAARAAAAAAAAAAGSKAGSKAVSKAGISFQQVK
jgi:hypothetical protein